MMADGADADADADGDVDADAGAVADVDGARQDDARRCEAMCRDHATQGNAREGNVSRALKRGKRPGKPRRKTTRRVKARHGAAR